jgi:L-amino acid N-acyltransferase YncA
MRLRDAGPDDVAGIATIWNPIIRETDITFWPTERGEDEIAALIRDRQAAGHGFLVVETDAGTIGGFASYGQFRSGFGYSRSMEHTVHVAAALRSKGAGRVLMNGIEDHARSRLHRLMIGAITASNLASLSFHRRMGYAEWGHIPAAGWKFGRFHDLVLMGKDLQA